MQTQNLFGNSNANAAPKSQIVLRAREALKHGHSDLELARMTDGQALAAFERMVLAESQAFLTSSGGLSRLG